MLWHALTSLDQNHEKNDLHNASKRGLEQYTSNLGKFPCEFLASEADQVGRRHHSNVGTNEDPQLVLRVVEIQHQCRNGKRPQDVGPFTGSTRGAPADGGHLPRIHPATSALSIRLDARRDTVSLVIDAMSILVHHRPRAAITLSILTFLGIVCFVAVARLWPLMAWVIDGIGVGVFSSKDVGAVSCPGGHGVLRSGREVLAKLGIGLLRRAASLSDSVSTVRALKQENVEVV